LEEALFSFLMRHLMRTIILSCEHASNLVPQAYRDLFQGAASVLNSHRGWDPGALELAKTMADALDIPLFSTASTRLLVEPNRSLGHRFLFSEFTRQLDRETKDSILQAYYWPHRQNVQTAITRMVGEGKSVLHVSVHTFVPVLDGEIRRADIGLLYDPSRKLEKEFCESWKRGLTSSRPDLNVRKNYPYLGTADGFTTHLRRKFAAGSYLGIELEVNQRLLDSKAEWIKLSRDISSSLDQQR
jgi:predicted N-formylglutamate amidohydrolase